MPNAKDSTRTKTPSILIVGDGGTGKTRFLATLPRPLILDTDKGTASIAGQDVEFQTFKDAPQSVKVTKAMTEQEGIYEYGMAWPALIQYLNNNIWPKLEKGELPFDFVCPDSLTTLAMIAMNYTLKGDGKAGQQPAIQHWGTQLRLLETLMDQLTAWPVGLVVTAHMKRDENLINGTKEMLPLVGGQLSAKIGIYFDEVYFTDVKVTGVGAAQKRETIFITETDGMRKQAKTRANVPSGTPANWPAIAKYFGRA